jgi:trehalose-6-phosphate synthase
MRGRSYRSKELRRPNNVSARPSTISGRSLIVLANRAPFSHTRLSSGEVIMTRSASGLVTALEPLLETHTGTWVAHGSGDADGLVVDSTDGVNVQSNGARYRLRYVWLAEEDHRGYYCGFANEGLWPLCHDIGVDPVFRIRDFEAYKSVNSRFVHAVTQEAVQSDTVVLVQDYHFALAPRLLKRHRRLSTVVTFWHIPWPSPDVLGACPWAEQLLEGVLGSDILGFQTEADCRNFVACAERFLDADADRPNENITYREHSTRIRAYPVGVDWNATAVRAAAPVVDCRQRVSRELALPSGVRVGVGIDRLDYTKGIPQKFLAIERLLESHPELRGRFTFLQVAEPSRGSLPAYQAIRREVLETRDRVNQRFGSEHVQPIRLLDAHHDAEAVYRLYRAADVCYVGSLRDGMNLVAKEFVSARNDERGVLVLSATAGAARQLHAALLVDPYDIAGAGHALHRALCMSDLEQATRMQTMRSVVRRFSAQWWAGRLLQDAQRETSRTSPTASRHVPIQSRCERRTARVCRSSPTPERSPSSRP